MATGAQNKIYSNQNFRPLKIRDTFQFDRGNVSGFAHTGGETGTASVIGPNSTPGGSPDVPFVVGVFSAMGEASQPGNIRAIDSELLFNYPGSTVIEVNPQGIDGQPQTTPVNYTNTAAASIAAIRGAITIGGIYSTGAGGVGGAGTGTAGVDPAKVTPTTITAGYLYGVQGKLIVKGALSAAGGNGIISCGIQGQLDLSSTTALTSPIAAGWFDIGASASSAAQSGSANIDGLVVYNTTAATANSMIRAIFKATYFLDLSSNSGSPMLVTKSLSSQTKALTVNLDGTTYWIPLYVS